MSQVVTQTVASPYFPVVAGLVGVWIVYSILYSKNDFPCFCEKCENKLIVDASNGDEEAQAKLTHAMQNMSGVPDYLTVLGPLAWIGLLAVILGVVYVATYLRTKTTTAIPQIPQMF